MKILVFGGHGKMGQAVAWDLVPYEVEQVGLAARRRDALEAASAWLKSPKVTLHVVDVADRAATQALMRQYDVGVNALPDRRSGEPLFASAKASPDLRLGGEALLDALMGMLA